MLQFTIRKYVKPSATNVAEEYENLKFGPVSRKVIETILLTGVKGGGRQLIPTLMDQLVNKLRTRIRIFTVLRSVRFMLSLFIS